MFDHFSPKTAYIPARVMTTFLLLSALLLTSCSEEDSKTVPTPVEEPDANNDENNDVVEPDSTPKPGNEGPTLERIGSKRAQFGRELSFEVNAEDPDGDPLTFSVFGDLPDGAKFDKETRRFSWTPNQEQLGQFVLLTFAASDGALEDRETVEISVVEPGDNAAPEIEDPGDQIIRVEEAFELQLVATDPDGDPLSFSIDGPSPQGSSLDSDTGLFRWTPQAGDAGANIRVIFVATDGKKRSDVRVKLVVTDLELTLGEIAPQEVAIGTSISFALPIDNPGEIPIVCAVLGATLPGSRFDSESCVFSWTPIDPELVNTTIEFAFQVVFQDNGEEVRLIATAPITVVASDQMNMECIDDSLEPNNTREVATVIDGDTTQTDLMACPLDVDIFSIDLEAGEGVDVEINFVHTDGDIDAQLLNGENVVVASGSSVDDNETIIFADAPAADNYVLHVYAFGSQGNSYDISVQKIDRPCENDDLEPNNSREEATPIDRALLDNATICPADEDFFAIDVEAGRLLRVAIDFDIEIDLDLVIFGPNEEAWTSAGVTDREELVIPSAPTSGTYVIKVFGFDEAVGDYIIEAATAEGCPSDDFEPNNQPADAFPLFPNPALLVTNLTLCGDEDWFVVNINPVSEMLIEVEAFFGAGMRLRVLGSDAFTVLSEVILQDDEDVMRTEVGNFLDPQEIFLVVDSAVGAEYVIDLLTVD